MADNKSGFSHLDEEGHVRMVDVGMKDVSSRIAKARAVVRMQPETAALIQSGKVEKGAVLSTARLAGIMAAKRTPDLIPLCHPLALTKVEIALQFISDSELEIISELRVDGKTGVEMEALTACSVAALTVYDMCKAVDRGMEILSIQLLHKSGGKSGDFNRTTPA